MLNLKDPSLLKTRCLIDGAWLDANTGRTLEVRNPSSGQLFATVPAWVRKKPSAL